MQELRIGPNEAGQRFDKYLKKAFPEAPMGLLYGQLRKKNITLNKKKSEGKEVLKEGDLVQCFFSADTFEKFQGRRLTEEKIEEYEDAYASLHGVQVIYEDANFLFLNKPAGILSQKATDQDLSINEWMIGYLMSSSAIMKEELATFVPSVCNRLDRNTSGLVLCGKSLKGLQALSLLLKERTLEKYYHCICKGRIEASSIIQGYLVKDEKANLVQITEKQVPGSSHIETRYQPLMITDQATLLEVELITGKTHQIRAHLSSIGHPILGDLKYGGEALYHLKHQLLHAHHVTFPAREKLTEDYAAFAEILLPLYGQTFTAPEPSNFTRVQEQIFA